MQTLKLKFLADVNIEKPIVDFYRNHEWEKLSGHFVVVTKDKFRFIPLEVKK